MADSNEATEQRPPRTRKKKLLPPLKGEENDDTQKTMPERGSSDNNLDANDPAADGATAAPKQGRKKRRVRKTPATESPEHATEPGSSEQQLIPAEGQEIPKPRRKKKKPREPVPNEAAEDARHSPDGQEGEAGQSDSGATRTRHIDVEGMPLAKVLATVRDDVVTKNEGHVNEAADISDERQEEEAGFDEDPMKLAGQAGGDANISDTIFRQTQNTRAFKAERMDKYQQRVDQERREREQYLQGEIEEDNSNRTLKCAVGFTKAYNYIGTILIGLMPGFAALLAAYTYTIGGTYLDFLQFYANFSQAMPVIFYVALTLVMLSVFERYDTGRMDSKSCIECLSFRHAGMVVIVFLPAYVISNAMYPTDMWIARYTLNTTAYAGLSYGDSTVATWRVLNVIRAVALVLGWLVIAFNTQFNKLAINLESELDDLIGEEGVELTHGNSAA